MIHSLSPRHRLAAFSLLVSTVAVTALSPAQPFTRSSRGTNLHPALPSDQVFGCRSKSAVSMLGSFRGKDLSPSSSSLSPLLHKDPAAALEAVASPLSPDFDTPSLTSSHNAGFNQPSEQGATLQNFWLPVLSSALLITGNTFGAGSLVLPQLAAGPGLGASAAIFGVSYAINLLSGLTLANVAITQYEDSEGTQSGEPGDIPSSFQEFVLANLKSPELAVAMSGVSFSVNSLILAFDISRVGFMFQGAGLDPMVTNTVWSAALVALIATQTQERVSQIASLCVMVLFASFGSVLLPGLASLTNPLADWFAPGTAALDGNIMWSSVSELIPVVAVCTTFQNIVPTIVKMLDYDRSKSFSAILMGSLMPLSMYLAWCWACLGQGGIDLEATLGVLGTNPLMALFSVATLAGSSIGCSLSCASEVDVFVKNQKGQGSSEAERNSENGSDGGFPLATVLATVGLPLALNAMCSNGGDLTSALHMAGGLGNPILYGTIPALMAYNQMKKEENTSVFGKLGLGVLGAASTGMLCGNLAEFATSMIPGMIPFAQAVPI
ncbi:hypothetical protein ACA910_020438 [Epithemia clementina (nom. ined.)]